MHAAFVRCVEHGTPFDLEARIVATDGRVVWVRAMGEAVVDASGTIVRLQGALQDISGHKDAELRVRLLTERLASTWGAMSDAFFTLDRSWTFTFVNDAAEELLQRPRAELLGDEHLGGVPGGGRHHQRDLVSARHGRGHPDPLRSPLRAARAVVRGERLSGRGRHRRLLPVDHRPGPHGRGAARERGALPPAVAGDQRRDLGLGPGHRRDVVERRVRDPVRSPPR